MSAVSTARRPAAGITGFLGRFALKYSLLALFFVLWEVLTRRADDVNFPPPSDLFQYMKDQWFGGSWTQLWLTDTFADQVFPSLARALGGWLLASVLGIALGTLIGRSGKAMDYLGPLLSFFRAVPPPALIGVMIVLVHGATQQIFVLIVLGIIWPILLNTVDGVRSVHATQRDTVRAFRISRVRWIFRVVLPAAAPKIFAGLRLSLSLAFILMVIAEYVAGENGIGVVLRDAQSLFDSVTAWSVVILLGVLGYVLNSVLLMLQRRLLGWQSEAASRPIG